MNLYEIDYENPSIEYLNAIKEQDAFNNIGIISPEHRDPIEKYDENIQAYVKYYRTKFPNNAVFPIKFTKNAAKIEAEKYIVELNKAKKEKDIQDYIRINKKWFIPASILKEYNFGHKENYLFPEMMLGMTYKVDYVICGRNSDGYHLLLIEFESPSSNFLRSDGNRETDSVNSGLGQIKNWKIWMDENRISFLNEHGFTEKGINIPINRINYCLVVGRRTMSSKERDRKNQLIYDTSNLNIINYDRIADYISQLSDGYSIMF